MPTEKDKINKVDGVLPGEKPQPASTAAVADVSVPQSYDLADDILQLEKLNLMRAVMLRLQGGRHPNAEVDALLKRRMNLQVESFQGPYAVRLICTLLMIFVLATVLWVVLWLFATSLELNYFVSLLSTGFATLIAAMAGVAVFHPSSVPDEKLVRAEINQRLEDLRGELQKRSVSDVAGDTFSMSANINKQTDTDINKPSFDDAQVLSDEISTEKPRADTSVNLALDGSDDFKP